jgi:hypothetical protein
MKGLRESLVEQCLRILQQDNIRNEFKMLLKPVIEFILYEISPYIYAIAFMLLLLFVMILAILFIVVYLLSMQNAAAKRV